MFIKRFYSPLLIGRLFIGGVFSGAGSFILSTLAASAGLPVIARLAFALGLVSIGLLIVIGLAALIGETTQRLRNSSL